MDMCECIFGLAYDSVAEWYIYTMATKPSGYFENDAVFIHFVLW